MFSESKSILFDILLKAGQKASDLGRTFCDQMDEEESRVRRFFRILYEKPLSWIFTLIFAPIILGVAVWNNLKKLTLGLTSPEKAQILVLLCGFVIACLGFWVVGTFLGSIAGFLFLKTFFGWVTAAAFFWGTIFAVTVTVIAQIIVFNLLCFIFIKLSNIRVIEKVMGDIYN